MTSQPSSEERNRLRLQAWEQRNQETSQAREQNPLNVQLFGQPYKTIKGDELSNRIQRMLGSYEDNTTAEPFSVPSSLAFPMSNLIHPISEPPSHQVCLNSQDLNGPCANPPSTFNSPKHHCEEDSQSSQLIYSSLQKTSPNDNINKRTIGMLHSQAFHPPLLYKQPKAAMMQKPTAYVRPMDGLDQVVNESPELKPSPEYHTRLPDLTVDKSIQGKADLLPQFLETKTSEVQYVEDILREMTCSWRPLLSGIHSPRPDYPPKPQCSVKEINPSKQDDSQASSTDQSHPPHTVLSHSSAVDCVCSSDSESENERGTDDQPMSTAPKSEPAHVSVASGDWELDKLIQFKQQKYRSKSHWAIALSPRLSLLKDGLKHSTVSIFSPARDASIALSLDHKTLNFTTSQKPCSSTQESIEFSDAMKQTEGDQHGGVTVHFEWTTQEEEPQLKNGPKVKTEKMCHKQSSKRSVVFESESTKSHHKDKEKVWSEVSAVYDQCTSCIKSPFFSDHVSPACSCSKPKAEARHKKVSKLSQKDEYINGYSLGTCKDTLSLVVKIDLNLLSKIPQTSGSLETNVAQKDDKVHEVSNSRKNDKEDQACPKKKRKLQDHIPILHNASLENSAPPKAKEKRESSHLLSTAKDCTHKCKKNKQYSSNAPQLNQLKTEPMTCPKNPKKSSGKKMDESTVEKPTKESLGNRPLLKFEDRHYPVKHYIKEAKRLKHKADAEMDKLRKSFHYLDAALFFIESGIAMESDPQISLSSYTMFAETVELIKFALKLTSSEDSSPAANDLIALCLRCQAFLQMAMFHHRQKTALTYSKTLIDHFNNSSQSPPDPSASLKGKRTPVSSSNNNPRGSAVIPQDIGQMALTYVNITTLFLNAHELWEQAHEFINKGSGLSAELDKIMGHLSLTSTMSSMVSYIRQGLHWLQMNSPKVK